MDDRTFILDENIRMNEDIIKKFPNCINVTDIFDAGTEDKLIIEYAKEKGYTIVTKDVRMTILSLIEEVPTLFVNSDFGVISLIKAEEESKELYRDLYNYFTDQVGSEIK